MTVTPTTLRALFPEFSNTTTYPDATINAWIPIATQFVGPDRWGDLTDFGITLWICHYITLGAKAAKTAATGGTPGTAVGVVNNKSVDKVSIGYDVTVATEAGAGFWNQTTYGTRYWHYVQMFGAGPVQCNTPGFDPTGGLNGGAWPGPLWPIF